MRIFSAVRHARDARRFGGDLWPANFHPALRRLGHEVVESAVDLEPASRFLQIADPATVAAARAARATASERLLDEVRRAHRDRQIDLFLSYFYNSHCEAAAIAEISRLGIPTINFFCNSMYQFELVSKIAPAFDYSWHPERDARDAYLAAGAHPVRVQMGADPELYRPVAGACRLPRACFVGQRYGDRDRWLASLVRRGVPVDLYGQGWASDPPRTEGADDEFAYGRRAGSVGSYVDVLRSNLAAGGLVRGAVRTLRQALYAAQTRRVRRVLAPLAKPPARDLSEVFSSYDVVLNFSNVWSDGRPGSPKIPHVRLRDFEAPMAGACYLTGAFDEIGEFYSVGREIDTYASEDELADKTRFYLANPQAAMRLREAGERRARRDHTWDCRFRELFSAMRLPVAAT